MHDLLEDLKTQLSGVDESSHKLSTELERQLGEFTKREALIVKSELRLKDDKAALESEKVKIASERHLLEKEKQTNREWKVKLEKQEKILVDKTTRVNSILNEE